MRGEQYYLILVGKDGTRYRTFKRPITLKELDEHTTKYENKKELIKTILDNTKIIMKESEIKDVKIFMQPNKKKDEYKEEIGPFFKKDAIITNMDATAGKFELMCMNKIFVLNFIKNYIKIPNFKPLIISIQSSINNNEDYMEELQVLADRIFSTYKGARGAYINMKKVNSRKKVNDSKVDSIEFQYKLTDEEVKEVELEYLKEYDRELLDIEDFNHYKDISPFDEHKTR